MALKQEVWEQLYVASPSKDLPVRVVAARGVPYHKGANRLQSLTVYLPATPPNLELVGRPVTRLPQSMGQPTFPRFWVHVHGGAWRDPHVTAASVEPSVALAFEKERTVHELDAIVSLNYTVTKFPSHPDDPYDPDAANHSDPAREAVHPQHVHDVLSGLTLLRGLGMKDNSYVMSGHSCGACLAFQIALQTPAFYGIHDVEEPVTPAALIGLNGLYDLPNLVYSLDPAHEALGSEYRTMLSNAFGKDEDLWAAVSPSRFDPGQIARRLKAGRAPGILLLDQSEDDQLVPMNQLEQLDETMRLVEGMTVVRGTRARGYHALPWESGEILWNSVHDTLDVMKAHRGYA